MTTLKQGDPIKDTQGGIRKIIEVYKSVLFISFPDDHVNFGHTDICLTVTETQLRNLGYTWDTPAWEPSRTDEYWYISTLGNVRLWTWSDEQDDRSRRDFLGIFASKELAEAALLEIRRKLGK